jgi:hypothetical protein
VDRLFRREGSPFALADGSRAPQDARGPWRILPAYLLGDAP